ncbi:Aldehyde dehydrogenase [hydrothermal vent metagenome]|uniref:Aldehyde dehydrogenase n=1 Tax=hydrothermal vent metagenome TaxID=652676 RepID=A0A3B0RHH0_9ZZZZ
MSVAEIFENMEYGPAPEDASKVRAWLAAHKGGFGHFIGGKWAKGKGHFASKNPANGEELAQIAAGSGSNVNAAVKAANAAFASWSNLAAHKRARVLYALARLIQKNSRFIAVLETLDNGKPIRETRDADIPLAARHFYYHAGWAQLLDTELSEQRPLGVVGQIIPWNFPFLMLSWKIAPALAAGNCVVLKPAEYTSLSALYFAELCEEAGVPPGVVNIVTGKGDTGAKIVNHPDIAKIAFTGSTPVGRLLREQTAGTGKKLTLELGGKSPFIVFEDADLDSAVEGLVDGIWFNQGEVCCAGSRLLVEEGVADKLVAKIKTRLEKFRLGEPLDKAIDMGAVADPVQMKRIEALVVQGVDEGAVRWQPEIDIPENGCFFPPTLLTEVEPSNIVAREEIFGPVLTVTPFRSLADAVVLANNTRYGLACSIWSENINRALEVATEIKAGIVWVNGANMFDAACGFGGYRESGFGREGGIEGMYAYLTPKKDWNDNGTALVAPAKPAKIQSVLPGVDRTPKMFVGGKQARPDGGATLAVLCADGHIAGRVGDGNRKDIRNAVEAASKSSKAFAARTAYNRAQILYFLAENLDGRAGEFRARLRELTGANVAQAAREVELAVARLFANAAWADKFDGLVHTPPSRNVALAVNEPLGVMGLVCPDEMPLLSLVSMFAPVMAMGNCSVVIPSERYPLIGTDLYGLLETSDVPAGAVNIITGQRDVLANVLAEHDAVDGLWYFGSAAGSAEMERRSVGNLKRTWVNFGKSRDWATSQTGEGRQFLRECTQVKNIWLPYGD